MCMRFVPVATDIAQAILSQRAGFQTTIHWPDNYDPKKDAYPNSSCAVFVQAGSAEAELASGPVVDGLQVAELTWGFAKPGGAPTQNAYGRPDLVFNTRLETAQSHAQSGRGMWSYAATQGRCLVPVRAFYENHATERVPSFKTGNPVKRPYRFTLAGSPAFLLAGVAQDGKFSLVTTPPNSTMAPIHNRMPLVLGPGESTLWLQGRFDALIDRSRIALEAVAER